MATKPAFTASPLSFPKPALIKTRASGWTNSSSSPCPRPSPQPAWTAALTAPGLSLRSSRESRASNSASALDWRASPATVASQWLPAERSQVRSLSAQPCGDHGRLGGHLFYVSYLFCEVVLTNYIPIIIVVVIKKKNCWRCCIII